MGKTSKVYTDKPPLSGNDAAPDRRLLSLVQAEIIPRLVVAHRTRADAQSADTALPATEIDAFAQALLDPSRGLAEAMLERYRDGGMALDAIYLELFTPAARLLGEMWLVDVCSFSQVTLGLWRIRGMVHDLSPSFHATAASTRAAFGAERRILLATLPGQQHTLGLSLLSEFFRRDGWTALSIPSPEPGLTQTTLSAHWFDVFGLSASMDSEIGDLQKTIRAARRTSQNPRLAVLVGGPLLLRQPDLCDLIGADGTATDAPGAVALAARLVQAQKEVRLN
jgi:methanogenic corrinoid protein MtbC1